MKTLLAITDLTRMHRGAVCIAGQDPAGNVIRPVLPPPGISERMARNGDKAVIFPFGVVEFEILKHTPKPPHTEDHLFDPKSIVPKGVLKEEQKRRVLEKSLFEDVAAIFEQSIQRHPGHSVADGIGPRSVGTVRPKAVHQIFYEQGEDNAWNYRLGFDDPSDAYYRLKITDLTWNTYFGSRRSPERDPAAIAEEMTLLLKDTTVYLRIGLSRGWAKFPGRCFLQVNGVYTFPDYLQGKTFAEFASN